MCFPALAALIPGAAAAGGGAAATGISLGSVLSLVGTGVTAYGAIQQGKAQSAAAQAAATQAENNKVIAQKNATDARERGNAAQQDIQLRNKARLGQQKNLLSERSIAVNSGSALDILGDTAMFGKLDEITTGQNFEREALAAETQAYNFSASAANSRAEAANAKTAGGISAFSTALGGISDVYASERKRRGLTL